MKNKPTILVTNDDGITAPGIRHLIQIAQQYGEVIVVAPDSPQSGKGHAISLEDPIRVHRIHEWENVEAYSCSGTPVDCVKLAKNVLFKDHNISLCLSGINHGSNAGINILYSGTMSAAMEASLENIDAIGFSHLSSKYDTDFGEAEPYIKEIIEWVLKNKLSGGKLLNVNIPNLPYEKLKGIKVSRQGKGSWKEEFLEAEDPRGNPYFWLSGKFVRQENAKDTDLWALEQGYISVVPSKHDLTDYDAIKTLKDLDHEI